MASQAGLKPISANDFRDTLVLPTIFHHGRRHEGSTRTGRPPHSDCQMKDGSVFFITAKKSRCQYCEIHGITSWRQMKYTHWQFYLASCQTVERDCHANWHSPAFDEVRIQWFHRKQISSETSDEASVPGPLQVEAEQPEPEPPKCGRLKGAINKF